MRPAIGFAATVATLFHLAFGCCLHGPHLGGAACCGTKAVAADHAEDCCDDHDHVMHAEHVAHDADPADDGRCTAECGCGGCTCTATVAPKTKTPDLARPAAVAWAVTSVAALVGLPTTAATESPADHRCPIPTAAGSPLFERLLV